MYGTIINDNPETIDSEIKEIHRIGGNLVQLFVDPEFHDAKVRRNIVLLKQELELSM